MTTLLEQVRTVVSGAGVSNASMIDWMEQETATKVTPYASGQHINAAVGMQKMQVMTRAPTYATAETQSWLGYKALVATRGKAATWGDRYVFIVRPMQEPYFLGRDERGRYVMVFNIEIEAAWK